MSRKLKKKKSSPFGKKVNPAALFQEALATHQSGNLDKAEALYKTIVQADPKHADSLNLLGLIAQHRGDFAKAVKLADKAVAIHRDPGFITNLGSAYKGQKKYPQAIAAYQQALAIKPDHFEAAFNWATTLLEQKEYSEARLHFEKILKARPNMPEALSSLGRTYTGLSLHSEALECFERILQIQPKNLQALNDKGLSLQKLKRFDEAIDTYKIAVQHYPQRPEAANNIGNTLILKGEFHRALSWYQKSIQIQPEYEEANVNLAWAYGQHGQYQKAIACLNTICKQKPGSLYAYSDYLFTLNYDPSLSNERLFSSAKGWWERFSKNHPEVAKHAQQKCFPNNTKHDAPLRIGFISPDFRQHPVGTFLLPLIRTLSKTKFITHCYAEMSPAGQDHITAEITKHCAHWFSTWDISDEEVAQHISSDKIDILIDLAGHSAHNRLGVLAQKPAPIQVSWLGYVNTTGLPVIDYRFTDRIVDPEGAEQHHSESLIYLPNGFFCYHPPAKFPEIAPLPALSTGTITFGSFNNIIKISEKVIDLWAQVLLSVQNATLLWVSKAFSDQHIQQHFLNLFTERGVSENSIKMVSNLPMNEYLAIHNKVDIALDPFPHNGHTITCHSLWMGVPVLTLKGERYAARMGASIMTRIGLEEFIAETKEEYINIAKNLTKNFDYLSTLRSTMRERLRNSPICNAKQFTNDFESTLLDIWQIKTL